MVKKTAITKERRQHVKSVRSYVLKYKKYVYKNNKIIKKNVNNIVMINKPLFFPDTDQTPKYAKFDFYYLATYITKNKNHSERNES